MQCEDANKLEQAMQKEYKSSMENGSSKLTTIPNNWSPIGCKWVLHPKRNATGHVVCYKAQLVAKGFAQVHKVEFS